MKRALVLLVFAACAPPSRHADTPCSIDDAAVHCAPNVSPLTAVEVTREVYWRAPEGDAPAAGWPVLVVYQGSFFGPASTWGDVARDTAFGGYHQARLQVLARDAGYLVVAPSALAGIAWQTNAALPWEATNDSFFVQALLDRLAHGDFGPVDLSRLYATGISSGGYMTSRMALSYPGRFRALAIESGSWATCAGAVCVLPGQLPADHPPTLLLEGEDDFTVPPFTVQPYVDALKAQGTEVEYVLEPHAGHEWLADSPERIVAWLNVH